MHDVQYSAYHQQAANTTFCIFLIEQKLIVGYNIVLGRDLLMYDNTTQKFTEVKQLN